jgi:hypothetical protein
MTPESSVIAVYGNVDAAEDAVRQPCTSATFGLPLGRCDAVGFQTRLSCFMRRSATKGDERHAESPCLRW